MATVTLACVLAMTSLAGCGSGDAKTATHRDAHRPQASAPSSGTTTHASAGEGTTFQCPAASRLATVLGAGSASERNGQSGEGLHLCNYIAGKYTFIWVGGAAEESEAESQLSDETRSPAAQARGPSPDSYVSSRSAPE
jgi:ABC-type phosphate transport system substrate-binding protein